MKIAVIDHVGNRGGASRFVRALLPAIRKVRPSAEIAYFGNSSSIERENVHRDFQPHGISVKGLRSLDWSNTGLLGIPSSGRAIRYFQSRLPIGLSFLPYSVTGNLKREIECRIQGFDIAFFPWPFFISAPNLDCPIAATFHDLNFKYYFSGPPTFSAQELKTLDAQMPSWLDGSTPIVSTHFMAKEIEAFYPGSGDRLHVAHLAPMSIESDINDSTCRQIVASLGIVGSYVLCPTHMCSHKNVGPLISAVSRLRARGRSVTLVFTGAGTELVTGLCTDAGVRLGPMSDVRGLGYVSNEQMDSLIQCAAVVVTPSLYEAGNGPGVDAWIRGTPVAMSNIPAFTEHLAVQGVRAQLFDPHDPDDIALKIDNILSNPVGAREEAMHSQAALRALTWDTTAEKYLGIFDMAISSHQRRTTSLSKSDVFGASL